MATATTYYIHTHTATATFARLELIKMQVRIALLRTTDISASALSGVEKAIDNKWINKITTYVVDSQGYCHAQLLLEIDWDEHNLQLSKGRAIVSIDEKWIDNTAIEVDEAIQIFNRFVSAKGLTTKHQYSITSAGKGKTHKELGRTDADPIKSKEKPQGLWYSIPELSELRIGFYLAKS